MILTNLLALILLLQWPALPAITDAQAASVTVVLLRRHDLGPDWYGFTIGQTVYIEPWAQFIPSTLRNTVAHEACHALFGCSEDAAYAYGCIYSPIPDCDAWLNPSTTHGDGA